MNRLLFFAIVLPMIAADLPFPSLSFPSLGEERDQPGISELKRVMRAHCIRIIEVKFVKKGCYSNHEVQGLCFSTEDYHFWDHMVDMFAAGRSGGMIQSCEFQKALEHVFRGCLSFGIHGLPNIGKADLDLLFPASEAIRWFVGPADWILLEKVPGSVTIRPVPGNYALHFVPGFAPKKTEKMEDSLKRILQQNCVLQDMLKETNETVKALAKEVSVLKKNALAAPPPAPLVKNKRKYSL